MLYAMPARIAPNQSRGLLIAVGQSIRADGAASIYKRLLALIGRRPSVVLITAAAEEAVPDEFDSQLIAHGAGQVRRVTLSSRSDAEQRATLALVESADLVLLCADQPLRLSTLLGGTTLARLLRKRNAGASPSVASAPNWRPAPKIGCRAAALTGAAHCARRSSRGRCRQPARCGQG
jgi:cyanophycinase